MAEEINNTTILHRFQTKLDRLETANKELEDKLLKQNENIQRLLMNAKLHNSNAVVPVDNDEEEGDEDPEQISLNQSSNKKEDQKNFTVEKSIHKLPLLRILGILFPVVSAVTFLGDAILFLIAHNPSRHKQENFAGLLSTIFILFYYLQYDVLLNLTHPRLYVLYQLLIWSLIVTGDIIYIYYHYRVLHHHVIAYIFICYTVVDTIWIFSIGYLKFKGYRQHMYIITIELFFRLISMLAQMMIIFIPIFGSHEVIISKSVAFFILFEFFSLSYTDMLDLKYSKLSRLCYWLLIIFTMLTIAFEYFVYAFEKMFEEDNKGIGNQTSSVVHHTYDQFKGTARYFSISRECTEFCGTVACYALLVLQFFMKKERKNK